MKFRVSNLRNHAVEFFADEVDEFEQGLKLAIRDFRHSQKTYRKIHRGEIREDRYRFDTAIIHVWNNEFSHWNDLALLYSACLPVDGSTRSMFMRV